MIDMTRVTSEVSLTAGAKCAPFIGSHPGRLSPTKPHSSTTPVECRLGVIRGLLIGAAVSVGLWALIIRVLIYVVSRLG